MEFHYILGKIGDFGNFQISLCCYAMVVALLMGMPHLSQIMLNMTPNHWCKVPQLADTALTEEEQKYLTIPHNGDHNSSSYSQCKMYAFNYTSLIGTNSTLEILDQIHSGATSSVSCKNGWNFEKTFQYKSLVTEHEWVCENGWNDAVMQISFWAGSALGPLIFGPMVDVFGRRPVIMILFGIAAVTGLLTCFVTSELSIFVVRFVAGVPFSIMCSTPYILVLEYVSSSKRKIVTFVFTMVYTLSWTIWPLIAHLLGSWRNFMMTVSPVLFIVVAMNWFLPESLTWLIVKKKTDTAVQTVNRIAEMNGRTLSGDFVEKFEESLNEDVTEKHSFKDLFKTKALRKLLFLNASAWTIVCCGYTGAIYATVSLNDNPFVSMLLGSLFETLAPVLQFALTDKVGRRWTCSLSCFMCFVSLLLACFFVHGNYWAFIILAIAGRVSATTAYNTTGQFCAELLPVVIRARGIAFRQVIGTTGTFLSSYVIYLKIYSKSIPLVVISVIMGFGVFVFLMLPETMNRKLTTSISDVDEMFAEHKFWSFPCIKKPSCLTREWKMCVGMKTYIKKIMDGKFLFVSQSSRSRRECLQNIVRLAWSSLVI